MPDPQFPDITFPAPGDGTADGIIIRTTQYDARPHVRHAAVPSLLVRCSCLG